MRSVAVRPGKVDRYVIGHSTFFRHSWMRHLTLPRLSAPPRCSTILRLAAIALAVFIALGASARPARGAVTADQVQVAINKAVRHIRSTQQANGGWRDMGRPGGTTALNALALLSAGVPENDPAVRKALDHLGRVANRETYVVALKARSTATPTRRNTAGSSRRRPPG